MRGTKAKEIRRAATANDENYRKLKKLYLKIRRNSGHKQKAKS